MTDFAKVCYLAGIFADVVHDVTTPEEFAEIKRRNATPEYSGCCASHDFMDANEAMGRAFKQAFGRGPLDGVEHMSDEDIALWNAAWNQAKKGWLTAS